MRKHILAVTAALVMISAFTGCGMVERFLPGYEMTKVGELWTDVPKMDGLAPSDIDMPMAVKLVLRTMIGNNQQAADVDWAVFTTPKPAAEIRGFYTNERMNSFGKWDSSKAQTCVDGKDKGLDGVLCVFQKPNGGKQTTLVIVATGDEAAKKSNIFFVRLEAEVTPAANRQ